MLPGWCFDFPLGQGRRGGGHDLGGGAGWLGLSSPKSRPFSRCVPAEGRCQRCLSSAWTHTGRVEPHSVLGRRPCCWCLCGSRGEKRLCLVGEPDCPRVPGTARLRMNCSARPPPAPQLPPCHARVRPSCRGCDPGPGTRELLFLFFSRPWKMVAELNTKEH